MKSTDKNEIRIAECSMAHLTDRVHYGQISIAFEVTSRFAIQPIDKGLGGLLLVEESVPQPYIKNYDAIPDEGPMHWHEHCDLSHWGMLCAFAGTTPDAPLIGGAVLAWNTPGIDMLEGRTDLAVLWDLRVQPGYRSKGVGHRLFSAASDWARHRGCRSLKIETQNINVSACRFYARQGCDLRTINTNAYADLPNEVQLLWYKDL